MSRPFDESQLSELQRLIHALCEESISAEQLQRLESLVLGHPEAEAHYVQAMSLHADLVAQFGMPPGGATRLLGRIAGAAAEPHSAEPHSAESEVTTAVTATAVTPMTTERARPWRPRVARLAAAGVLAAALAAGVLLMVGLNPDPPAPLPRPVSAPEPTDRTVAVLLRAPAAVWEQGELPLRPGAPLNPGWLRLKAGYAHIEFYSGATVILEGPAEFQLISRTEAFCKRGKLRATVSAHAQGFTIGSPQLDLVDRGTDFGMNVGNETEVHVFQGKVEIYDPARAPKAPAQQELTTGQGVRVEGAKVVPIAPDPKAFRAAPELAARWAQETQARQREWQRASQALREDPSLRVYYPFEPDQPWSRTLLDQAGKRQQPHDGAIVGATWAAGRWRGKQGLEFKRVSDRVRINVPGEFDSLTLMAWVRVDALPNLNNSLMMTDGWEAGEPHWQIGENGMIVLGVQGPPKTRGAHYHAPGVFTPDRFGQWVHLAVTYDADAQQVTHYVDGRPVAQLSTLFEAPLRIGEAELGNWNVATHRNSTPIRNLSGCMDEFMLFSRALGPEEIERLFGLGRPPG